MKYLHVAGSTHTDHKRSLPQPLPPGEGSDELLPLDGGGWVGVSPLDRAFTLTEMLVSIIVFVFVMTLAFNTLLASTAVRQAASARIDIFQNGRTLMDVITRELRNATLRQTDTEFTLAERQAATPNSLTNARGRFILNDWPPVDIALSSTFPDGSRVFAGNGLDDDADARTDEEAFDGRDNDGDGESDSPLHPLTGEALADGLDNNGDGFVDEGIDEDLFYPRDMINFMTLQESGGGSDRIEVGYAIDTRSGRDLLRRSAFTLQQELAVNIPLQVDGLYQTAIEYLQGGNSGPADPNTGITVPWFDPINPNSTREVDTSVIPARPDQPADMIEQVVELVGLNVLGFDCKAYYHDYAIAEENESRNPLAGFNKTIDITGIEERFNPYSFPVLTWDSSVEWRGTSESEDPLAYELNSPFLILPNGADDMALVPGSNRFDDFTTPEDQIAAAMAKTDGLPRLIEVTLFIQDQNRYREEPIKLSTRVFLPFVTGDE